MEEWHFITLVCKSREVENFRKGDGLHITLHDCSRSVMERADKPNKKKHRAELLTRVLKTRLSVTTRDLVHGTIKERLTWVFALLAGR
jgi:hypothetical protein